ncbi:Hsp20/alpha crystallin family protein [bacterium]|nr:Hsp20/alpha crystallin family protein [bacterium]
MSDAFDSFLDLRRRLYRMLDAGVSQAPRPAEGFAPPLDVVSTPEGLTITVELPGMAREDIAVELQGNLLTIAGERRTSREDAQQRFFRRERPSGQFKRSLALPTTDHEELSAALKDGVLTVTVHKPGRGM